MQIGDRVFLVDGPITSGVVVSPQGAVLLDGETEPVIVKPCDLIAATFTEGRRVFRHTGGPHRFGVIPILGKTPKLLSKARMNAEEDSVVVQWDNGDMELVVKNHLTPIVYNTKP